jgi:hypothetical protein
VLVSHQCGQHFRDLAGAAGRRNQAVDPIADRLADLPTIVVTGTNPYAIASSSAIGRPSSRLGGTKMCAVQSNSSRAGGSSLCHAHIERDFRSIKTDDLDLRPIHHRQRVRAHVLICMLACHLVWHLRKAWAPVTFTDEHPPQQHNPVAAAQRSTHAGQSLPSNAIPTAPRYAASAACLTTWPPSSPTGSATPTPTSGSANLPMPHSINAAPLTSSAPPSPDRCVGQTPTTQPNKPPRQTRNLVPQPR